MTNRKISELAVLTAPVNDDFLVIVDASEPELIDRNKKVACKDIARALVFQTAASGATYSFSDADNARIVKLSHASSITATIPTGLPADFSCMIIQTGAGAVTFNAASGVTIRSPLSATQTAYQYATASLISLSSNEFLLCGDVTA